jgi:hypothetical protein
MQSKVASQMFIEVISCQAVEDYNRVTGHAFYELYVKVNGGFWENIVFIADSNASAREIALNLTPEQYKACRELAEQGTTKH